MAGCSKQEVQAPGFGTDPDAVRVEASVGVITRTNPLGTPDEQDRFNVGDQIAVFNGTKTVTYKFDGTSWGPVADGNGVTDYLIWDTPASFRAWYPVSASGNSFTLPQAQDGTSVGYGLSDADFMTWSAEYNDGSSIPADRKLSIVMMRRMALVTIVIDKVADEYADLKDIKVQVKTINSAHSSVKLQPDGTFRSEGEVTAVNPYSHEVEGKSAYSAVVVPGAAVEDVFLSVDIDGYKDETKKDPYGARPQVTGIPAAKAGNHYTYKLVVGKESVKIAGVTIEDWTAGTKIDGKFEAEVDDYSEWDGKSVKTDFSGEGTQESPYLITSAAELAGLAKNVNDGEQTIYSGKYFKLTTNIDLMGHEWMPIGNNGKPFDGIFDGNSKIITNMAITVAPSSQSGAGLFGNCSGASVSNVVLKNAKITYNGEAIISAGLICGEFSGTVKNCRVDGSIVTFAINGGYCGGIIGSIGGSASVSDCEVAIHGETSWGNMGGIVGYNSMEVNLTIDSCIAKGEINGGNSGFGGIAGYLLGRGVLVKNCTSYVKLGKSEGTTPRVGGLVGSFYYGKAESCTVYGIISFINDSGLVGGMFSEVYDVTLSNLNFSGGIDVTIQGSSAAIWTNIGAFIAWAGGTATTATGCTYKKSGTGDYPAVGICEDESFDPNTLDIKGI